MSQQEEIPNPNPDEEQEAEEEESSSSESSDEEQDQPSDEIDNDYEPLTFIRRDGTPGSIQPRPEPKSEDNTPEANIARFNKVLNSTRYLKLKQEAIERDARRKDPFNFPPDKENWREEDLMELWGDAPAEMTKPGWDPKWAEEEELDVIDDMIRAGRDAPVAPFYVPYRKFYPVVPRNNRDIKTPKAVIEELDRIEEFLKWVSFIFRDGSS